MQPRGDALIHPDYGSAGASLVYLCYAARRGRPLCLLFSNPATGTDFRSAGASLVYLCFAARRGRPLCLPFLNPATGTDFRSAGASLVYLCSAARRGRPLCLPFFNAAAGAIRMGRHRGPPLHSGRLPRRGCPGKSRLRQRAGVALVHPGHATAWRPPLHSGRQPRVLSGWADTGVCPYIPESERVEAAPTFRKATASGLRRYIHVTQPRGGCVHIIRRAATGTIRMGGPGSCAYPGKPHPLRPPNAAQMVLSLTCTHTAGTLLGKGLEAQRS